MQNGFLSSLPFLIMWIVALLSGWLSDYLVQKETFSVTTIKKIFTTVGKSRLTFWFFLIEKCDKFIV